jgi:myo-inositol-1(or 4)-monophosphatase
MPMGGGAGTDPNDLLALAVDIAGRAAELARAMRNRAVGEVSTKGTDTDVVTAADRAVERMVLDELRERRPGDAVLGEETGERDGGTGVRWILDPIDGTVNYLYDLPYYALSLAAEVDGTVVAGVVRSEATGQQWTAVRGQGAHRDGRRLTGSTCTDLGQALVATGFGYHPLRRAHQAQVLVSVLPAVRDIRRLGSAALDLCLAAEGRMDAYFEKGLNLWDYAAGALVATEAGLRVGTWDGDAPGSTFLLAAPPALYPELADRLTAADAAGGP